MKKSFMTRVLATGLSFAMAFSMAAATNVSVASAAAKPAMASKQFAVRVGGAAKSYKASAATQKSFKISKATVGNTAKATVKVNSTKKSIKVTPGTVTGSTVVTIKFLNTKTKKYTTKKYRCVVKAEEKKNASAILSAEAAGAKTVKVVFDGDLVTTSGVAIKVLKGKTELKTKTLDFVDSKTATVTLEQSLTTGTYTVSATGVVSEELTKEFTVDADEYVATIEFNSTKAPMMGTGTTPPTGYTPAANKLATVSYVLKNQYNEVVANSTPPTFTISTAVPAQKNEYKNGVGTLVISTNATAFIPGDKVYINAVLTNGTHVATVTETVEIVLPASYDSAEFAGVYNKTLKKMDTLQAAKLSGAGAYVYQLLFTTKDQYGNALDSEAIANAMGGSSAPFTAISTNPVFLTIGTTYETALVDGKEYVALPLAAGGSLASKGGTATIQLISSTTGVKSSYEITADAAGAVEKFTLSAPSGYVVKGEKVQIPFTALDQYGNEVTAFGALNGIVNPSVSGGAGATIGFVKQTDGSAKLILNLTGLTGSLPSSTQDLPMYLTSVVSTTGNYSSANVNVKDTAYAKSISGLKSTSTVTTTLAQNNAAGVDIKYTDLDILDQYGRVMSNDAVKGKINAGALSIYAFPAAMTHVTMVNDASTLTGVTTMAAITTGSSISKINVKPATEGSIKVAFGVTNAAITSSTVSRVPASEKSITFTVTGEVEYVSYEVKDLGKIYYDTTTTGAITAIASSKVTPTVYAVRADGSKVVLPATAYTVTTNGKGADATHVAALTVNSSTGEIAQSDATAASGSALTATDFQVSSVDTTYKDKEVEVYFAIKNSKGAVVSNITKKLLLSNKKPQVAVAKFDTSSVDDGKVTLTGTTVTNTQLTNLIDTSEVKDQYGKVISETPSVQISKLTETDVVDGWDYTGSQVQNLRTADTFKVTFKYAGGYSISLEVVMQ